MASGYTNREEDKMIARIDRKRKREADKKNRARQERTPVRVYIPEVKEEASDDER